MPMKARHASFIYICLCLWFAVGLDGKGCVVGANVSEVTSCLPQDVAQEEAIGTILRHLEQVNKSNTQPTLEEMSQHVMPLMHLLANETKAMQRREPRLRRRSPARKRLLKHVIRILERPLSNINRAEWLHQLRYMQRILDISVQYIRGIFVEQIFFILLYSLSNFHLSDATQSLMVVSMTFMEIIGIIRGSGVRFAIWLIYVTSKDPNVHENMSFTIAILSGYVLLVLHALRGSVWVGAAIGRATLLDRRETMPLADVVHVVWHAAQRSPSTLRRILDQRRQRQLPEAPTCLICLEALEKEQDPYDVGYCFVCASGFHLSCLSTWIKRSSTLTCPLHGRGGNTNMLQLIRCWRTLHEIEEMPYYKTDK